MSFRPDYSERARGDGLGSAQGRLGAPWAERFGAQAPGSPEFSRTWQAIAREDPQGFEAAQQTYAVRTYFDPQANRIRAATGIDVAQRSFAL